MRIEYFQRNGSSVYMLNGKPMSVEESRKYRKLCEAAYIRWQQNQTVRT